MKASDTLYHIFFTWKVSKTIFHLHERKKRASVWSVGVARAGPGVGGGGWEAGVAYLTNAADAHVQGVRAAASSIQDLGCQLHYQVVSPGMTLERTGYSRIVIPGKPFVVTPLILDVIVGGALLGSEVLRIWRAVLRAEKKGHTHITQGDQPPKG